jgi:hypothetical protein
MSRVVHRERWQLWLAVVLSLAVLITGTVLLRRLRKAASGEPADLDDDDDWLAAGDYERLTGIGKDSYERRLLVEAQSSIMGEWTVEPEDAPAYTRLGVLERGSADDVRLEGDGTEVALVVLFRSDDRPRCVFGWRVPIWPVPPPDDPEMGTPEGFASIVSLNLVELVEAAPGLPACDPDVEGITWIVR